MITETMQAIETAQTITPATPAGVAEIDRRELTKALTLIRTVARRRASNPALSGVTLSVNGSAHVFASNMDVDVDIELTGAAWAGEFETAADAASLAALLKASNAETVEFDVDESGARLNAGQGTVTLRTLPKFDVAAILPPEKRTAPTGAVTLRTADFLTGLDVAYAAASQDYQAVFRGVLFELQEDAARFVATDGFRLAYQDVPVESGAVDSYIVPAASLKILRRAIKGSDTVTAWRDGELHVVFLAGSVAVRCALMGGTFPDYHRVIPGGELAGIETFAEDLEERVNRVGLMADATANHRVDIDAGAGLLELSASGKDGEASEILEVRTFGQDEWSVAFNGHYLADALQLATGSVVLRQTPACPSTPVVITCDARPGYLALVVPLRTK